MRRCSFRRSACVRLNSEVHKRMRGARCVLPEGAIDRSRASYVRATRAPPKVDTESLRASHTKHEKMACTVRALLESVAVSWLNRASRTRWLSLVFLPASTTRRGGVLTLIPCTTRFSHQPPPAPPLPRWTTNTTTRATKKVARPGRACGPRTSPNAGAPSTYWPVSLRKS